MVDIIAAVDLQRSAYPFQHGPTMVDAPIETVLASVTHICNVRSLHPLKKYSWGWLYSKSVYKASENCTWTFRGPLLAVL